MRPTDLARLRDVGDPQLHPDGDRTVVVVTRADLEEDTYRSRLHLVDGDGARTLTHGPHDTHPRWSPDGTRIAFLRKGPGDEDRPQVAVLPAAGGEAEVRTHLPLGVSELAWSPDGDRLALVAAEWVPGLEDLEDEERGRVPKRYTRLPFRSDGRGYVGQQRTHVWLLDLAEPDADPVCLTPGDDDEATVCWRPDGTAVLFSSARHDTRETDADAAIWQVDVDGGELRQVLAPGWWQRPTPTADGGLLVAGHDDALSWPAPPQPWRVAPGGTRTRLAPDLDTDVAGSTLGLVDTTDGVLALAEDRGAVHLVRLTADGHEVLVGGARTVTGFSATPDGSRIAFTASHPGDPGELWLSGPDGDPRVATSFNDDPRGDLVDVSHLTYDRDGVEIDAWLLVPPDAEDDIPLLLNVHGGPTAQYGHVFFDEFQVEAAAGFAVVGVNPRGSSGRGTAWSRSVVGAWPDEDSLDLLDLEAAVDAALAHDPRISAERVGIMGGSYGGYATARILARSDRFRSAVVERGLLSWVSFSGTSDIGPYFDRMFLGVALDDDAGPLWQASPVRTAGRVTTPTLVIHSEQDHRCPPEQGIQLFSALRRAGVEAELLLFPSEGHELSRSGAPKHRVERFEAILEWHARHLGVTLPTDAADRGGGSDGGDPDAAVAADDPDEPNRGQEG